MKKVLILCLVVFVGLVVIAGQIISAEREADARTAKATSKKATTQKDQTTKIETAAEPQATTSNKQQSESATTPMSAGIDMTGEQINWYVISSGATKAASTNYQLQGTVGQLAVGDASSTNYTVKSGYWQDFSSGGSCCVQRGNVNGEGDIDIADLTFLVGFMFKSGAPPPCPEEGNVNAMGEIDIADLTFLVNFMFKSGPVPPPC
jgi:hypothetical protein